MSAVYLMSEFINALNVRIKSTSSHLGLYSLKVLTGLLIGLTVALVGQEIIGYGNFSLTFVSVVILSIFLRISKYWRLTGVIIFDLICLLIAMLLRMYIQSSLGA